MEGGLGQRPRSSTTMRSNRSISGSSNLESRVEMRSGWSNLTLDDLG
jgi:hypothetical protein